MSRKKTDPFHNPAGYAGSRRDHTPILLEDGTPEKQTLFFITGTWQGYKERAGKSSQTIGTV